MVYFGTDERIITRAMIGIKGKTGSHCFTIDAMFKMPGSISCGRFLVENYKTFRQVRTLIASNLSGMRIWGSAEELQQAAIDERWSDYIYLFQNDEWLVCSACRENEFIPVSNII